MGNKGKYLLLGFVATVLLSLSGCFKEDEPVQPQIRHEIELPWSIYTYQTYFNLEREEFISFHLYNDWDLGFESSDTGFHVILNYARFMMATNLGQQDFDVIREAGQATWLIDASSGNLDSTALGTWWDTQQGFPPKSKRDVYFIKRGSNESGNSFGQKKIQFLDYDGGYVIRFANPDGTDDHTVTISKDTTVRFVLFSLDSGGMTKTAEAPKQDWDLCFTKYSTILYESDTIPTPYLVRGVYINSENLSAVSETKIPFDQITEGLVQDYHFSSAQDVIGYDWKVYQDGVYVVIDNLTYILRKRSGKMFKMRFTSFHNASGERGYPKFELVPLN